MVMLIWAVLQCICRQVLVLAVFFVFGPLFLFGNHVIGLCQAGILRVGVGVSGAFRFALPQQRLAETQKCERWRKNQDKQCHGQ
jgi:hypothetical protein